jgi:hypothetical protein
MIDSSIFVLECADTNFAFPVAYSGTVLPGCVVVDEITIAKVAV